MAKKKTSQTPKKPNEHHQRSDNAVSEKPNTVNSNKKKAKTVPNPPSSSAVSYLLLIGLSITIATVAIVYNIEDLQLHLVKLTNYGSSPSTPPSANIPEETITKTENIPADANKLNISPDIDSDILQRKNTAGTAEKSAKVENNAKTADTSNGESSEKETKETIADEKVGETKAGRSASIDDISAEISSDDSDSGCPFKGKKEKIRESLEDGEGDSGCPFKGGGKRKRSSEIFEDEDGEKVKSRRKDYEKYSITCREDYKIRKTLDAADLLLDQENFAVALKKYDQILVNSPYSPRALWGKSLVLDQLAEKQRSNAHLEEAMLVMSRALRVPHIPADLAVMVGSRLAQRQEFRGWDGKAASTWAILAGRFPTRTEFRNQQGISYLRSGQNEKAREIFQQVLDQVPDDGMALVHLGFILKVIDLDYQRATSHLQRGIDSGQPGANVAKFYYHLGDAYIRLNQSEKANEVYRRGAERGQFISQYQRSLYNADTPLTGRPWWTAKQTTYTIDIDLLEKNWKTIRDEGLSQLDMKRGSFVPEEEHLRETGDWKQFTLYQRGIKNEENCNKVPKTCAIIDQMPDAWGCKRGQVKYSVMHPGVHVWPHTGPTNCRIRAHLGLVVPEGPRIRVVNDTRTWTEGKVIIFDDSFEHEVWHDGTDLRMILIVDFWHPDLTQQQKKMMAPI